jgi:DNA-binding response OmpR family regulator
VRALAWDGRRVARVGKGDMSHHIVIVDDDRDIVEILAEAFESEGFETVTFQDGAAALLHMLANPPALVLTDLVMPGLSGGQLVERLRAAYGPELPILVMSASVHLSGFTGLDVQAFLSKPFDLNDLLEVASSYVRAPSTIHMRHW